MITARFSVQANAIVVKSIYEHAMRCKSIAGGRWDPANKVWRYPALPATAEVIGRVFEGVEYSVDQGFQLLLAQARSNRAAQADAASIKQADLADLPPIPITVKKPWGHQLRAFWYIANLWGGLPMEGGYHDDERR